MHAHMCRKDDFLGKDDKTIVKEGEELQSEECIMHHASCIMHHVSKKYFHPVAVAILVTENAKLF